MRDSVKGSDCNTNNVIKRRADIDLGVICIEVKLETEALE